jgi:protein tyrosine phosphatase (PTP) superfamily phosphohydrolase (DUF442 family)
MSTEDILNFQRVDDRTITGGQPTEDDVRAAAVEGYQAVVNLATIDRRYSLPDEGGLAQSLGMSYHHIPVVWANPQPADFDAFATLMDTLRGQRVLVHCAANYRATAFYSLYALKALGWTEEQAAGFRANIWLPGQYPVWDEFIAAQTARIVGKSGALTS